MRFPGSLYYHRILKVGCTLEIVSSDFPLVRPRDEMFAQVILQHISNATESRTFCPYVNYRNIHIVNFSSLKYLIFKDSSEDIRK